MKTLPLSEAKSQLSGLVELVRALEEQVMITCNGRPAAVLVSAEEFERWKETIEGGGEAANPVQGSRGGGATGARPAP